MEAWLVFDDRNVFILDNFASNLSFISRAIFAASNFFSVFAFITLNLLVNVSLIVYIRF